MDSNEAVPSLLILVIVLLYYLYRIKMKKLHEEEKKYIETFLIRDKDISNMRVGSPMKRGPSSPAKITKIRHQDSQLKGPESPLNSKGNLRSMGKLSPLRKTSGTLQGKVSPKIGNKLQFSEETGNYLSPKGKMYISQMPTPNKMNDREYVSPKIAPKDTVYNFDSIRLQKIQENQQTEPTRPSEQCMIPVLLVVTRIYDKYSESIGPGFENTKIAEENLKVQEVVVKKDQLEMKGGRREICFKDSDSESDHEQVKIIHDSSFEEEPQDQEEIRTEAHKKQLPGKTTLNLEYLEDLGSGMGLKKYIAKKTVQEYIPNTDHGSKTISQLLSSQKNVAPKAQTSTITSQTAQAAKPQGSIFSSNTSTSTTQASAGTGTGTGAAPANKPQGGLFAGSGSTTQSQPSGNANANANATTATTANKPQGGGLFGNSTGAQGTAQAATGTTGTGTGTGGGLFGGNKTATTTTTTTTTGNANATTATTANKPQGGGLFGNSTAGAAPTQQAKPQGTTAGTAPLQVQTTGLFAQKTQSPDNATPLFPKSNQQQQPAASQPTGKMRERSAADDDLNNPAAQKKMNISK